MTIAFDARMVSYSGIGTHIRGLLRALRRLPRPPQMTLLGDLNELTALRFQHGYQLETYTAPVYSVWSQFWFPRRWNGAQALHVPHYNVPYRYEDSLIVTIHDLIHLLFPWHLGSALKLAYARYTFGKVAQRADRILCDSEYTRKDVMERLGVEADRVAVLPCAVDERFQPATDLAVVEAFRRRMRLPRGYLLAVGLDKPHKNFPFLLRVLRPLWKDGKIEAPLAVAGCGGKAAKLQEAAAKIGVEEWIRVLDWVPENEMPLLYQAASALIFPSTYEGFGLPVLEAQRVGTPVAASDAASIPEVGGEGAVYFDPFDEDSCRHALARVVEDSQLRAALIEKGHANEQRFSYAESARRLAEIYQHL